MASAAAAAASSLATPTARALPRGDDGLERPADVVAGDLLGARLVQREEFDPVGAEPAEARFQRGCQEFRRQRHLDVGGAARRSARRSGPAAPPARASGISAARKPPA